MFQNTDGANYAFQNLNRGTDAKGRNLTQPKRIGSIEISQDIDFQRRSWKVQRIAWIVMLTISIAALFGLFGEGPLANAHAGAEGSSLRVDYDRFLRQEAPVTLTVHIGAAAVRPDSMAELWIDRQWLAEMEVTGITPEPEKTRVEADRMVYTFRLDPSSTPARVTWYLETHLLGRSTGRVGVVGGPSYSFSQFAYP